MKRAFPGEGRARAPLGRLVRRGRSMGWLLFDQAVFAAGNFLTNIMFARWLDPISYGLFALSFSGFILLSVVHWSMMVEPLLVVAPTIERARQRAYVMVLVKSHVALIAILSLAGLAGALLAGTLGASRIGWCVGASCVGGSMLLGLTAARRLCLVFLSAKVSALVGLAYLVAVLATAWGLRAAGIVSWLGIWAIMSGWSLVGTSVIAAILLRRTGRGLPYGFGDLVRGQGTLARWGIPAAGASWVRSDGLYLALAHFLGLAVVAETRAMISLCAPVVQLNSALNASWLVGFSRAGEGGPRVEDQVRGRAVAYTAMMLPGFALLLLLHAPIVRFAYQGRYSAGAWQLPWFYLALAINGVETLLASALKATTRARIGYFPQIAGCAACAAAAGLAVPTLGRAGAVVTVLSASLVGVFVAAVLAGRHRWRAGAAGRGAPLANWLGGPRG